MKRLANNRLLPALGIMLSSFMLMAGFYQLEIIWLALNLGRQSWELPFGMASLPLWLLRDLWYLVMFTAWWLLLVSSWFYKVEMNS